MYDNLVILLFVTTRSVGIERIYIVLSMSLRKCSLRHETPSYNHNHLKKLEIMQTTELKSVSQSPKVRPVKVKTKK